MQKHPDADAFVRAYLEQPTDVVSRLVFADWLEETGEPHNAAWAHFIRLKIEADQHPIDSSERRDLDRRADSFAPQIRAKLAVPARQFVDYPKAFLQLLPAPNITVRLAGYSVSLPVLELMPESIARENLTIPLNYQQNILFAAAVNPRDTDLAQKLAFILNREIVFVGADEDEMREALDREFGQYVVESVTEELVLFHDVDPLPAVAPTLNDAPVVRLVNLIIQEAINLRADRILLYPDLDALAVRYRIDGEWVERDRMPIRLIRPVSERIALMAKLVPLDWVFSPPYRDYPLVGNIPLTVHGRSINLRVSIVTSPDGPTTQIDVIHEPIS